MPSQSSNQTALRASGHKVRAYAAFFVGAVVLTGAISATPAESAYPILNISYTTSTGSSANVRRGYRVVITTAAGVFKFATTVRAAGTISSTNLPIREASRGSVRVVAGDLIEVRSVMQPGDKLVADDETFAPDELPYSNQNSVIPPVCCSGGPYAGIIPTGFSSMGVDFDGTESYTLDEDSGGSLTHAWSFPTATGTTTSSSSNPTFVFTVGEHVGTHTVTDDDNSATATQVVPVRIFDDDNPPYEILLDSPPRIDIQSGASCAIELFANATLTDIPDGTLCVIFLRETINGSQVSYGSATSGRSHILMTGYTNGDTFAYRDGLDTLTMDIISPLQYYAETLGLSKVGLRDSSPAIWGEIEGSTCWLMCIQILRWYTWLTESWDVTRHAYLNDEEFPALFITEQDPISQVRELVQGLGGRFVCLRHGWFQAQPRLALLNRAHRLLQATTLTHGDDDILEYEFRRDHRRRVARVRVQGFRAGTTTSSVKPLFAVWPGDAPGSATTQETVDKQIASNTADFYERAGHIGAELDRVYVLTDGSGNVTAVHHAPSGTLVIPGYFIYDLYAEWQAFDPSMATNLRGVALSDMRHIIEAIDYEISNEGVPSTTLTIKAETFGDPGVDDTPPAEETNDLPPYNLPSSDFPGGLPVTPVVTPALGRGAANLAMPNSDGSIYNTDTGNTTSASGGPDWTGVSAGVSGTPCAAVGNAFAAGGLWLATSTGFYHITAAGGTPVATLKHTFAFTTINRTLATERGFPNQVICVSYTDANGTELVYSTDNSTFTAVTVTAHAQVANVPLGSVPDRPIAHMSGRTSGQIYVGAYNASGYGRLYRWSIVSTPGDPDDVDITPAVVGATEHIADFLLVPFGWSSDDSAYIFTHWTNTGINSLYIHTSSGNTDISAVFDGHNYAARGNDTRRLLDVAGNDPNTILMIGVRDGGGFAADVPALFLSRNRGASWTMLLTEVEFAALGGVTGVALPDRDFGYLYGANGTIYTITLSGTSAVIDSRVGDLLTAGTNLLLIGA